MADKATNDSAPFYRRIVLKLSGESFNHGGERGISMEEVLGMAEQPVLGVSEQRLLNSYSAWRHARTAERYKRLADDDLARADQLLRAAVGRPGGVRAGGGPNVANKGR